MLHGENGYIVAAYAVAIVVVLAVIAAIVTDYRAQRRALERLALRTGLDEEAS